MLGILVWRSWASWKVLREDEHFVLGMADCVHQVIRDQPRVDRVQDSADARNAKVHLQVAVAVPFDDAHLRALFHPQGRQRPAQAQHALVHGGVVVADQIPVDNLLIGSPSKTLQQDMLKK